MPLITGNAATIVKEVAEFEPLGAELLNAGLTAAGIGTSNMSRLTKVETVLAHILGLLSGNMGVTHPAHTQVKPAPSPTDIIAGLASGDVEPLENAAGLGVMGDASSKAKFGTDQPDPSKTS